MEVNLRDHLVLQCKICLIQIIKSLQMIIPRLFLCSRQNAWRFHLCRILSVEISCKLKKKKIPDKAEASIWSRPLLADLVNLCLQDYSTFFHLKIGDFSPLFKYAPLDMNIFKLSYFGGQWKSPTEEKKKKQSINFHVGNWISNPFLSIIQIFRDCVGSLAMHHFS